MIDQNLENGDKVITANGYVGEISRIHNGALKIGKAKWVFREDALKLMSTLIVHVDNQKEFEGFLRYILGKKDYTYNISLAAEEITYDTAVRLHGRGRIVSGFGRIEDEPIVIWSDETAKELIDVWVDYHDIVTEESYEQKYDILASEL